MSKSMVFDQIIDSCMAKIRETPEYAEWDRKHDAFHDSIESIKDKRQYEDTVWAAVRLHAEQMFLLAWELRGNPDALFQLPDSN